MRALFLITISFLASLVSPIYLAYGQESYDLNVSMSSDRSDAVILDGESVSGNIFIFTAPDTGINQVTYYLDDPGMTGAPFSVDSVGPFDFSGTNPGVVRETNGIASIEAEHYVNNVTQGSHGWVIISSDDYSGAEAMQSSPNIGTNINTGYVTTSPRLDYQVEFSQTGRYYVWIRGMGQTDDDDSLHVGLDGREITSSDRISLFTPLSSLTWSQGTMDGPVATIDIDSAGAHTINVWMREDGFIFDKLVLTFESDCPVCIDTLPEESTTAIAFDTDHLSDGTHNITAMFDLADGGTEIATASFSVQNSTSRLTVAPSALFFNVLEGGTTASLSVDIKANDATSATFSIGDNASWLTISPTSGSTPASLDISVDVTGLTSGTYNDIITVTAAGYLSGTIAVTLVVNSATQSHNLQVSMSSDRSDAVILDGESVSGNIFIFTAPDTGINQVTYYLDDPGMTGAPFSVDSVGPFDFSGTNPGVVRETNGIASIEAEHYVNNVTQGSHGWVIISSDDYSGAEAMQSSPNIGTNINTGYVTTSPRLDYQVEFSQTGRYYVWIRGMGQTDDDDSLHVGLDGREITSSDRISLFTPLSSLTWSQGTMDGPVATIDIDSAGAHTINVWMREDGFIFDKLVLTFESDCPVCIDTLPEESTTAIAFDTDHLSDGTHNITAMFDLADGGTEIATASFSVQNSTSRLTVAPSALFFNVLEGGTTASLSVDIKANDATSATFSIGDNASWLTISPTSGSTPASLDISVDVTGLTSGTYNDIITVTAAGYLSGTIAVTLVVNSATQSHNLQVSMSSDRSDAVILDGESVSGNIFIFTAPDTGINQVTYYLDDPGMTGAPFSVDSVGPFDFSGTNPGVVRETNGIASIEAEHYVNNVTQGSHGWVIISSDDYSGAEAMQSSPNIGTNINTGYVTTSPRLDYQVEFSQTGRYYVWIRGMGQTDDDDSLHVGLDGREITSSDRISLFTPLSSLTWSQGTMDGPVATIDIDSAGAHTINVWMREDGFIFDKLVLTFESDCPVCIDTLPEESTTAIAFDTDHLSDGTHNITAMFDLADGGTEIATASFSVQNRFRLPFEQNFDDGDITGWEIVEDSGNPSTWQVSEGQYYQSESFGGSTFESSYHTGIFSYLTKGMSLTNYQFRVDVTPLSNKGNDVGVLFRYQDSNNYYRLSLNSRYGFTRLEKKVEGFFFPLATNARGYIQGEKIHISIVVINSFIHVSIDDDSIFGVSDSSLSYGSVAFYTQDLSRFDNLSLVTPPTAPTVVISSPIAHSATNANSLLLSAIAYNIPLNHDVKLFADGIECEIATEDPAGVFTSECFNLIEDNYSLTAVLYDNGIEVSSDTNVKVGALGDYIVAIGDSITNGSNDNFSSDNNTINEKIISIQGYESNLTDMISSELQHPIIIFNEGIPGDTSFDTLNKRVDSILERHPKANKALLLLGTNDSNSLYPTDSGLGCTGESCIGTFKGNLQEIIDKLNARSITPIVASILPSFGSSDPLYSIQNLLIQEYNTVISEDLSGIQVGPDFFSFFLNEGTNYSSLFSDNLHPNGYGFVVMAHLWFNNLTGANPPIMPFIINDILPSNYKQNILETGDYYYIDELNYEIASIPNIIENGLWIMTAESDKNNLSDTYLSFTSDRQIDVYVAYDENAESLPNWLQSFADTGEHLFTTNPEAPSYRIYSSIFAPGNITLGGNMAVGASGAVANYVVIIKEE